MIDLGAMLRVDDTDIEAERTLERCAAAMYFALGKQTKLSKSGFEPIFTAGYHTGRVDLSGIPCNAMAQIAYAGLNIKDLTESQMDEYRAWRQAIESRKAARDARIIVTRPFSEPYSGSMGSCGVFVRVSLVDGLGRDIESRRVECLSVFDPEAVNNMHGKGAFVSRLDNAAIDRVIGELRRKHPVFTCAAVQNNNLR